MFTFIILDASILRLQLKPLTPHSICQCYFRELLINNNYTQEYHVWPHYDLTFSRISIIFFPHLYFGFSHLCLYIIALYCFKLIYLKRPNPEKLILHTFFGLTMWLLWSSLFSLSLSLSMLLFVLASEQL